MEVAEKIRRAFDDGRDRTDEWPPHTYLNYANGKESAEKIYGHDTWRLKKLRRLKEEWDPENRFRFYAPIV